MRIYNKWFNTEKKKIIEYCERNSINFLDNELTELKSIDISKIDGEHVFNLLKHILNTINYSDNKNIYDIKIDYLCIENVEIYSDLEKIVSNLNEFNLGRMLNILEELLISVIKDEEYFVIIPKPNPEKIISTLKNFKNLDKYITGEINSVSHPELFTYTKDVKAMNDIDSVKSYLNYLKDVIDRNNFVIDSMKMCIKDLVVNYFLK